MTQDKKKPSLAYRQAYEIMRDMILRGEIAQGTKVVEEKLAASLGVSRTPIRDSIRKLEQEGLIVGKKVVTPTEADLRNRFQVRMLLEGHAARSAATFLPDHELAALRECVEIGQTGELEEIMKANEAFHDIIVKASNNPVMVQIIDQMQSIIYLFRRTVVYI
ncbi:transcriptional regulator, GntR family [Paenibacillus algorifonticola]|uniref:Transcriptional regulator, GntR family n=1 Tax=Paenibacillus algorifonticola TaxID=684063 RepID=A0A1I2F5Y8_9BACL|nr:transcriptional regulator, GntR family [Paenibacillus algorifonticola]